MKGRGLIYISFVVLLLGCETEPPRTAFKRLAVKTIDFANVQRRDFVPSKTHFISTDDIAVCIQGFAGRNVTIQLFEERRGLVKTWNETIPPPRVEKRTYGAVYGDPAYSRPVPVYGDVQVDTDWVVRLQQVPPGNYRVVVTSNEGIQQQTTFVVDR
jgi:hypothetical protein